MVHFTVEEENLVCVYYKADRRRTMGRMTAADFEDMRFLFTDE